MMSNLATKAAAMLERSKSSVAQMQTNATKPNRKKKRKKKKKLTQKSWQRKKKELILVKKLLKYFLSRIR